MTAIFRTLCTAWTSWPYKFRNVRPVRRAAETVGAPWPGMSCIVRSWDGLGGTACACAFRGWSQAVDARANVS